jgi:hypothetical protein
MSEKLKGAALDIAEHYFRGIKSRTFVDWGSGYNQIMYTDKKPSIHLSRSEHQTPA